MITSNVTTSEFATNASGTRGRVLFISYHFPPVGGAGVQRPVKFVKYLERLGWDSSVLMAANPSVPVTDDSLCKDIPGSTTLIKARTLEPGYKLKQNLSTSKSEPSKSGFGAWCKQRIGKTARWGAGIALQPDPQILWYPSAFRAAKALLKAEKHDVIVATAPPYSNLILGSQLSKEYNLPLVVDFRDEWDLSSKYLENSAGDWFSARIQNRMQKAVLRRADAIIATTQSSTQRLREKAAQAGSQAEAVCIYNGFDEDDFNHPTQPTDDSRQDNATLATTENPLRIVYTGTLWNLTSVEPVVQAVEQIAIQNPELTPCIQFQFIGRKTKRQTDLLDRLKATGCQLKLTDYCDHEQALQYLQSADLLCLLLSDVAGAERVVPAKLFEYLAIQKEVISIVPDGESADILNRFFSETVFKPTETERLASWIVNRISNPQATNKTPLRSTEIKEFSRAAQTEQLAELLNRMCQTHSS